MAQHIGALVLPLAQAGNAQQRAAIGRQGGGRVFLFLETMASEGTANACGITASIAEQLE